MRVLIILLLLANINAFSQSIVVENFSPEEIKANFRNKEKDFFVYVTKSSSKTEGFGDKDSLTGVLYWKLYGSEKIEKFEYDKKILKEEFEELQFLFLGENQWEVNIFKCKEYRPVSQITFLGDKKIIVPLESQYLIENKIDIVLETSLLIDDYKPLKLGRTVSSCNGNLAYYARPNKSKKLIFKIEGKELKYEELVVDLKDLNVSKIKCFYAIINKNNQLELKVYNDYPSNTDEVIFTKIYELKTKESPKKEEEKK